MAKVSRAVLESFFKTGDKPTQEQFASLIQSMVHFSDDFLFGLNEYNPNITYLIGNCTVLGGVIYQATAQTTGEFNPDVWIALTSSTQNVYKVQDKEVSTEDKFITALTFEYTPEVAGNYSIDWYTEAGRDGTVIITNQYKIKLNETVIGESAIRINDNKEFVNSAGFIVSSLDRKVQKFTVEFTRLSGSSGLALLRNTRVRIGKI